MAGLVIFLLSLFRYWPVYGDMQVTPAGPETWNLAHNLREHGEFANPFMPLRTGPSAHLAPAFPAFLALLTWVFGTHAAGAFAFHLAAALAASILLALFPLISERLGLGLAPGVVGAAAWLMGELPLFPNWEASYAGLLIAVAACLFRGLLGPGPPRLGTLVSLSLTMGVLLLLSPTSLPVLLCWIAWLTFKWKRALFRFPALFLILLPALMTAPWVIRNYLVFERFVLIRDNFGIELSVSNNDCASFGLAANHQTGCFQKVHPNASELEAVKVLLSGEVSYNDTRLREARSWIGRNPGRFAGFVVQRAAAFWMPHENEDFAAGAIEPGRRSERLTVYAMTLLSLFGCWLAARRDRVSAAVLASWLILWPAAYYLVQYEDRYRYPIMWVTFLLGALPLSDVLKRTWLIVRDALDPRNGKS
ncbi:MAG TPA: hypothetical protein PKJ41_17710 [Bryobacteraceae bacterium]|nr:hypothetical protein [Bryobacteraceae bacterium]HPT25621.1 hypothetical protein [Bryobacteraceae bacterium]